MNLRLMQASDFEQLQALWLPEGMDYYTEAGFLQLLAFNADSCFVIELGGRIIAAACGSYDGRRGIVQSVVVLPEYRGQGYGQLVVQATITALKVRGATRIRLFVYRENTSALAFYDKLGFAVRDEVHYLALR